MLYVQFFNRIEKKVELGGLNDGVDDGARPPRALFDSEIVILDFNGVARSEDDGATWQLVFSLFDEHDGRGETTPKMIDSLYERQREDEEPDEHWAKAYIVERNVKTTAIETIMPHPDGGVIIRYFEGTRQTRGIAAVWDNLDNLRDFYQDLRTPVPARAQLDLSDPSRWGVTAGLLEESFPAIDGGWFVVSPGNFSPRSSNQDATPAAFENFGYAGTVDGKHYWYSHEDTDFGPDAQADGQSRFIYMSEDHGENIKLIGEFEREPREGPSRREDLRISDDGDLYLIDHITGTIHAVDDDKYELIFKPPDEFWIPQQFEEELAPPDFSMEFDSGGNIHVAIVHRETPLSGGRNGWALYHLVIPKEKPEFDSVAVFTGENCSRCADLRGFLTNAEIDFEVNPELSQEEQARVNAFASESGFPVVARAQNGERLLIGGDDRIALGRLISASYPSLIDTYAPRTGGFGTGFRWANILVEESSSPIIVVERADGIFAYQVSGGGLAPERGWTATNLFGPPGVSSSNPRSFVTVPGPGVPIFPGSGRNGRARQYDVDFNDPVDLDGVRYFYGSRHVTTLSPEPRSILEDFTRSDHYLLGSTAKDEEPDTGREVQPVSQLIPAATFFVQLPDEATVTEVRGELDFYVTEEGEVTNENGRFYRVVADLRRQSETAVNGNLMSRLIGGFIEVTNEGVTTPVSLFLNVDNTRLTAFDGDSPLNSTDLTMEAVNLEDGRWIITNNLAVTNSIECGDSRVIAVGPHSFTTITPANEAEAALISKCLRGLETEPLNIPTCTEWDDAQLVLAGEMIGTLANSLPLRIDESGIVNYVQAFGNASFTGHRIVNASSFAQEVGCPSDINSDPVVVVKITGEVISDGERIFEPDITIVERGAVRASNRVAPSKLTVNQEVAWLEFEAVFLESALLQLRSATLGEHVFGSSSARLLRYLRDINAVRAAAHCGHRGFSVDELLQFLERRAERPDAVRPGCLQDFFQSPARFWPTLGTVRTLGTNNIDVMFPGVLIDAFSSNPTMAYLKANAEGNLQNYETFFIERAQTLEAAAADDSPSVSLRKDLALDHYARIRTRLLRDFSDLETTLGHTILFLTPVQRDIFDGTMTACLSTIGSEAPLGTALAETPTTANYRAGIPCVDNRFSSAAERELEYQRLGLGMRDPFFAELVKQSNNDFSLLMQNLQLIERLIPEMENRMQSANSDRIDLNAWQADDTDVLDLLSMLDARMTSLAQSNAVFLDTILPGLTRCGAGLATGLVSREAMVFYVTTGVAFAASPLTGGASLGVAIPAMAGAGVILTAVSAADIAQQWENLSDVDRVSAGCQTAFGALMTVGGVSAAKPVFLQYRASTLKLNPPKVIDLSTVQQRASATALALKEQFDLVKPRSGELLKTRTVTAAVQELLRPAQLRPLISGASKAQQLEILALADTFNYQSTIRPNANARAVFEAMIDAYKFGADDPVVAMTRLRSERSARANLPEGQANIWLDLGAAMIAQVAKQRGKLPSSLSLFVESNGLVGADAALFRAILDSDMVPALSSAPNRSRFGERRNDLLLAYLKTDRVQDFIKNPARSERVYSAREINSLRNLARDVLEGRFTSEDRVFFDALGDPAIARTINNAIVEAGRQQGLAVGDAAALSVGRINIDHLSNGRFKVVNKIEVEVGGNPAAIELVIKKGAITPEEFALTAELGRHDLAAKQYGDALIEAIDSSNVRTSSGRDVTEVNSIVVEEFIPGETWSRFASEATPQQRIENARLIAELDAKLYMRTLADRPEGRTAFYNRDLHVANIKFLTDESGTQVAKIVDYDGVTSRFHRLMTEEQYFFNTLARRNFLTNGPNQAVEPIFGQSNQGATSSVYVRALADALVEEGMQRTQVTQVLTEASSNLRSTEASRRLFTPEELETYSGADTFSIPRNAVADIVDQVLREFNSSTSIRGSGMLLTLKVEHRTAQAVLPSRRREPVPIAA